MQHVFARLRHYFFVLILSQLWVLNAQAALGPQELVQTTLDDLFTVLMENADAIGQDPELGAELTEQILLPHVDFNGMTRFVLGKHWRKASEQQRVTFTELFRQKLKRTYASSVNPDEVQRYSYKVLGTRGDVAKKRVMVRSELNTGSQVIPEDYRLWLRGDEWKVYDVVVEGISLMTSFRSEYSAVISRSGIDGLLEQLQPSVEAAAPATVAGAE